jgi:hypothetical protein
MSRRSLPTAWLRSSGAGRTMHPLALALEPTAKCPPMYTYRSTHGHRGHWVFGGQVSGGDGMRDSRANICVVWFGCSVTTRVHLGGTEPPRSPHRSGQAAIRGCIRCCRGATTDALPVLGCLTWRYALTIGEDVGLSAVLATKSPIEVRSVFLA